MSGLTSGEKLKLETLFRMESGYVLDFSNSSFQRFVGDSIYLNIYDPIYENYGDSKANRLRALWNLISDSQLGKLIEDLLIYCETKKTLGKPVFTDINQKLLDDCFDISFRLLGKKKKQNETSNDDDFLKKDVDEVSIRSIPIDNAVIDILENRIIEVKQCLNAGASLSVLFLCGSILEGLLLGVASTKSEIFNKSSVSPKDKTTDKVKQFPQWTLSNFIDVAFDTGFIGLDVKKHSHALRDFRNYIHPYQQMSSGFNPDNHTAKISWQVLKAAMHDLSEKVK